MRALLALVLAFSFSLVGCGDDGASPVDGGPIGTDGDVPLEDGGSEPDAGPADAFVPPPDELELEPMDPPVAVPDGTTFVTIAYGPGSQQVMDAFLRLADPEPTPVVIFIHGGGFTGGSRTSGHGGELRTLGEQGIAYITIDYTLLEPGSETEGVIKSVRDCRRALQFVRYHAETLNVDPERIGLQGGSAGAGTSLWLAFHDEMADPSSPDLIERESTRVTAAAVRGTQATYELLRWPSDVFSPTYPLTIQELLGQPALAAQVATFYGLPLSLINMPDELEAALMTPELEAYRAEMDMLAWMSSDDPPVHVHNAAEDRAPGEMGFDLLHHPLHAQTVADRAAEVGLADSVVEAPALDLGGDTSGTQFLAGRLLR